MLLVVGTQLPLQRVGLGFDRACVESSRTMMFLSPVICDTACTAKLHVVVALSKVGWPAWNGDVCALLDLYSIGFDLIACDL